MLVLKGKKGLQAIADMLHASSYCNSKENPYGISETSPMLRQFIVDLDLDVLYTGKQTLTLNAKGEVMVVQRFVILLLARAFLVGCSDDKTSKNLAN